MLIASDILRLSYTPDLTEGGIAFTCRSLATTTGRTGGAPLVRLRQSVAEVAAELAFRRTLSEQDIPFGVLGALPFTHPERYDVSLGGHRCNLKSFTITSRPQITQLRRNPARLLQAPALVPMDEFAAEGNKANDLYLFAFLLGVVSVTRVDEERAAAAGQPNYLIHPLPEKWVHPANWQPFKNLVLKSDCEAPISVEIGGLNAGREFVTDRLELPSKKRVPVEQCFHSLAYIHADRRPEARIGMHSPVCGEPNIILAHEWGNIWVYGMDIFMTGWLSHEDFRRKAKVLNIGVRTLQDESTSVKNLQVPISELNPLRPLFERVRIWAESHKTVKQEY